MGAMHGSGPGTLVLFANGRNDPLRLDDVDDILTTLPILKRCNARPKRAQE
jgi:hypothetical protein